MKIENLILELNNYDEIENLILELNNYYAGIAGDCRISQQREVRVHYFCTTWMAEQLLLQNGPVLNALLGFINELRRNIHESVQEQYKQHICSLEHRIKTMYKENLVLQQKIAEKENTIEKLKEQKVVTMTSKSVFAHVYTEIYNLYSFPPETVEPVVEVLCIIMHQDPVQITEN